MTAVRRTRLAAPLCVALSALCFYASNGLHDCWPLAWLAPAPLLVLRSAPGGAFAQGLLAYGIGRLSGWAAYASFVPPPVLGVLFAGLSMIFGATMAVTAWIAARGGRWQRVLAYPVTMTAVAAILSRISADASTWSPLYTQTAFLPILQTAALAGPWSVVFLLSLLPSAIAFVISEPRPRRRAWVALGWVLGVEAAAIGFGYARLAGIAPAAAASDGTLRVGVAASDPDIRFFRTERRDEALSVLHAYARRVGELAARGARLVVLPEKMTGIAPAYRVEAEAILADAARTSGVRLVAGLNLTGDARRRNVAWVFGPDGQLELEYDKRLMVPRFEDGYEVGRRVGLLPTEGGVLGVAVCRDLMLPQLFHAYGRAGARLLVAPAWDFTTDAAIQARVPVLRAIEGGYPVVRVAQEGLLVVADAAGRILLRRPSWEERETLALVDVPLGHGRTPYAVLGDWFAALDAGALVILIAVAHRQRRRRPSA